MVLAEPVSLAVVRERLDRGTRAIAEDEDGPGHGVVAQHRADRSGEAVDPTAEVCGLDRDEDARLGRDLDHERGPQRSTRAASSEDAMAGSSIRKLAVLESVRECSSTIVQATVPAVVAAATGISTKVGPVGEDGCGVGLCLARGIRGMPSTRRLSE
jgi:hypothetical protein